MNSICGLPYFEVEVDRFGSLVDPSCLSGFVPPENLFAIVHGWNADMNDARALYERFFDQFCRTLRKCGATGFTAAQCGVLGIFWPSEKYADPSLTPGGAAGLRSRAEMLRRALSYRLMKHRAAIVGRGGVASLLNRIGTRVHLIGHSFGARVITAAVAVAAKPVASMTLLQAAFSQNSFSPEGAFRSVVTGRKCAGPILITHSIHDEALGLCYPIASRILRQNSSGLLGGAGDPYGALGRNGALHTPEASFGELLPECAPYSFAPGRIYNLRADAVIRRHGDIVKPETAWAAIAAANDTIVRSG